MCLGKIERLVEVWGAGPSRQGRAACGAVVSLAYTPEAEEGSYVLAHAGVSLRLLEEDEATNALELRDAMGA
jgi:hydrogenase expression/formation protein HypC